jgi:hypothetical protein
MLLLYVDPSGSGLLMQILAPVFVLASALTGIFKRKIMRAVQHVSRMFTGER